MPLDTGITLSLKKLFYAISTANSHYLKEPKDRVSANILYYMAHEKSHVLRNVSMSKGDLDKLPSVSIVFDNIIICYYLYQLDP